MFYPWRPIFTGVFVLVEATGTVPTIDVATTCRTAEKAVTALIKDSKAANFDSCMLQQREAREILVKNWKAYPSADRARCVKPESYMPSYVEWLTCLENAEAARKISR